MLNICRTLNRLPKVDYDGVGNSTEIVIQEPKTKNSVRSIPLMQVIIKDLQQWRNVHVNKTPFSSHSLTRSQILIFLPLYQPDSVNLL